MYKHQYIVFVIFFLGFACKQDKNQEDNKKYDKENDINNYQSNSLCFCKSKLDKDECDYFISLLYKSDLGYIVSDNFIFHKIIENCEESNNEMVLVIGHFIYTDGFDIDKIFQKFQNDNISNLKIKVWNKVFLKSSERGLMVYILHKHKYLKSWKNIVEINNTCVK